MNDIELKDPHPVMMRLLADLPDAILVLGGDWRIVYANRRACEISRIKPEHMNRETLWELFPELLGTEAEQVYRQGAESQAELRLDAFYYPPFGKWFDISVRVMGDGIVIQYSDVTALVEADQALRASEERTHFALSAANGVGMWNWDVEENVVFADVKFAELYGVDPAQARSGAPIRDFTRNVHPEDRETVERAINDAVKSGAEYAAEYRLIQKDGSIRWVATRGQCTLDEEGKPVRFPGVAIDVTDQKLAEEERRQQDAYLRLLLDSTAEAFYAIDESGRTTSCNRAFLEMLGFKHVDEVIGRRLHGVIHHSHPDGSVYEEQDCPLYRAARTNTPAHVSHELFFRADGSSFPVEYHAYPIFRSGEVKGAITTFVDITERRRTEAALIKSEKLAAVGRLASSIAHEINNPLESVTNLIYLAQQSVELPEVRSYLEMAEKELRRVANITSQTLRFHRQSSKPVDITCLDLFSTVLTIYEGRLKNANIRVEKRKRANRPVQIYEGDIRQVLNNVVGNAIDAMPHGGRLLVRSREGRNWLTGQEGIVLTIADTGVGMDRATLARVFEAFFTTKGINGTGLGLWISAEIMERHQGRIGVRSRQSPVGSGTVVTLFLPFVHADQP